MARTSTQPTATVDNTVTNDALFDNVDQTSDSANDVAEGRSPQEIARELVSNGEAKVVKAVVASVQVYTNDQNFTSLIFRLRKPITLGNHTTDSVFVGWKVAKAVLVSAGFEAFNTLLDFDDRNHTTPEDVAKAKQRINLATTFLLPGSQITLLQREMFAGQEVISNPFSTRTDENAYFVPNVDSVRYDMFDIKLSAKANAMLDEMQKTLIASAAQLIL